MGGVARVRVGSPPACPRPGTASSRGPWVRSLPGLDAEARRDNRIVEFWSPPEGPRLCSEAAPGGVGRGGGGGGSGKRPTLTAPRRG